MHTLSKTDRTVAKPGSRKVGERARPRALVVDDEAANRLLLRRMLSQEGYEVVEAADGRAAVETFAATSPDLVLMDVMMPAMDGYEAARHIRAAAGQRLVPILFLTALTDEAALAKCVECGGDDFLTKPFRRAVLHAKITSFERMREVHELMRAQRDELAIHRERMIQEESFGRNVLDRVIRRGRHVLEAIDSHLPQTSIAHGNLLLAAPTPTGGQLVLLGRHGIAGLSGSVGAIPLSEIFYDMSARGSTIEEIARRMNEKLNFAVPESLHWRLALVRAEPERGALNVWNGGVTDVLLRRADGSGVVTIPPVPYALGSREDFAPMVQAFDLAAGDRVLVCSPGLVAARGPAGERFGRPRLAARFAASEKGKGFLEELLAEVAAYSGDSQLSERVVLAHIECWPRRSGAGVASSCGSEPRGPLAWELAVAAGPDLLRKADVLPQVFRFLGRVSALRSPRREICGVLSEIYAHVLDRLLLARATAATSWPETYAEYQVLRKEALARLERGVVRIRVRFWPGEEGGTVSLRVEDAVQGFPYGERYPLAEDSAAIFGQRLPASSGSCRIVDFHAGGNGVEVEYSWS
jgi:CheY-like chemotaxis protein